MYCYGQHIQPQYIIFLMTVVHQKLNFSLHLLYRQVWVSGSCCSDGAVRVTEDKELKVRFFHQYEYILSPLIHEGDAIS